VPVYSPAITDFVFMVRGVSYMFVTGPNVVKTVTHEDVSFEQLGGADVHGGVSGVAHFVHATEPESLAAVRELIGYLPANNLDEPPSRRAAELDDPVDRREERLLDIIPDSANKPYDMREVIGAWWIGVRSSKCSPNMPGISSWDSRDWQGNRWASWPTSPRCSPECSTSAPRSKAPASSVSATASTSRSSPFEDVPGFLPGVAQEHGGIIKHGAKLLYAFCEATVPKLTVITRKAYGGAYDVMSSKHIRGDINLAWPTAEIAVMGPKGAVEILFKKEIDQAADKEAKPRGASPNTPALLPIRTLQPRADLWTMSSIHEIPDRASSTPCASCPPSGTATRRRSMGTFRCSRFIGHFPPSCRSPFDPSAT
jgi:propionyl-CoA carboxylase beta chain